MNEPIDPRRPCPYAAGSEAKIAVLTARAAAGLPLFLKADALEIADVFVPLPEPTTRFSRRRRPEHYRGWAYPVQTAGVKD